MHRSRKFKVLYPSYFDLRISRSKGRRVSRRLAIRKPDLNILARALDLLGLRYEIQRGKHRPSRWYRFEGRILVEYEGSKEELLKTVAEKMRWLAVEGSRGSGEGH